jgi:hypothetical protein
MGCRRRTAISDLPPSFWLAEPQRLTDLSFHGYNDYFTSHDQNDHLLIFKAIKTQESEIELHYWHCSGV